MSTKQISMSNVTVKILILLSLTLLLSGCFKASEEQLIEYTSDEGKFTVSMPGKPSKDIKNIPTAVGAISMYLFMVEKTNIAYMVAYSDYPAVVVENSDPEKILDGAVNGAMQNMEGKLISQEQITYGEDPGREISFNAKKGIAKGKAVIVLSGNRLYQVMAVGSNARYPNKTVKKVIDSLEIW